MQLIKSSFEIVEQEAPDSINSIRKHVELCGRTCYKSTDKIKEGSSIEFVNRLINSKHFSVLEHGTIYLTIPKKNILLTMHREKFDWIFSNPYTKVNQTPDNYYITTNYRVIIENNYLDILEYITQRTEYHEQRVSVKFICSRAIANEFVRHRKFSFSQESTRYVNYSKDKFGNEITYIIPSWLDYSIKDGDVYSYNTHIDLWQKSEDANTSNFLQSIAFAEKNYMILISNGWKPEQARDVLPLCTKTELIMTGFISDWKGFFEQRALGTTGAPHIEAKLLAEPLMNQFKQRFNYE